VLSSVKRTLKDNQFFPEVSLEGAELNVTQDERLKFIGARKIGFRAFERKENERKTYAEVFSFKSNREVPFNEESNEKKELNHFESTSTQAQTIPSSSRLDTDKVEEIGVIEGRTVWQIHNKYILSQIKSGLLIIDQHIAHERILYEKILATFENNLPSTQQLLFPQTIELTPADIILVKELAESLQSMGFVFKIFSKNTVVIDGLPSDVRVGDERKILMDVLDEYRTNEQRGILDIRENLAKAFACKAAIKAGDKLNTFEMNSLIDQLFATTMPYACPHGRPIVIKLTLEELDKRFGRTPQ
jgi:DNA mismatch repair protein MutL